MGADRKSPNKNEPRILMAMDGEGRLRLVSYDLDGTLIDGTAFLLVARHFGFEQEVLHHDHRFRSGEITLQECFEIEFGLLAGRGVHQIEQALATGTWFPGIKQAVDLLHGAGIKTLVLTDNPDFIAHHTKRYGIDDAVCSQGEVKDDIITGAVNPRFDKWAGLQKHLDENGIDPMRVAHVGNDINDVNVWKNVGLSVCVEPTTPAVAQAADIVFEKITDHQEIARVLLEHHNG